MTILDETTWEMFWDFTFGKDPKSLAKKAQMGRNTLNSKASAQQRQ